MSTVAQTPNANAVALKGSRNEAATASRTGRLVAALPPGDPLRYLLHLSVEDLRGVMNSFPNVLRQNPRLKELVVAVLESKTTAPGAR